MSKQRTKEYDVAVIGGGPAGYVAAIRAGRLGLRTVCIERWDRLGGTCLNVGCIPSKTLLYATELFVLAQEGKQHGLQYSNLAFDFEKMMRRKERVVEDLAKGVAGLFRKNKVERIKGTARVTGPNTIAVGSQEVKANSIVLATGSVPIPLPFLPFDEKRVISSTGALALSAVPKKLILVGAGVVGLELGSVYRRLGTEVTVVEFLDHICPSLDGALSKELHKVLKKQGMTFHLSSKVTKGEVRGSQVAVEVEGPSKEMQSMTADVVLVAIGRAPYSEGLGLEEMGVEKDKRGFVRIDGNFRTSIPSIYAIGDLVEGPMLAHRASEEGIAVAEIIAGGSPHVNYMAIPNVVYTSPEVAGVGMTEEQTRAAGLSVKTGTFPFKASSRAHCTGERAGLVKIIAEGGTDRLLGMHIINAHASEMIGEGVAAIEGRATVHAVGAWSHAHPTYTEAIKEAALAVHKAQIHL